MINWEGKKEILKELDKESCVKFALKAAKLVQRFSDDSRVSKAIEAAENWLANPCEENAADAYYAAHAAYNAANAVAYTAYTAAAYAATYTARGAAYAAANTANTAYAAADAAADAATNAAKADPSIKPILIDYLRELYLESLPQDERDNWLVQAMIGVSND